MGVAAAIIGGAAIGAGGSIFSGIMGASGASKQAAAVERAATIAQQTAYELDNRARADLSPFRDMGMAAGGTLMNLLTGGGDVAASTKASPLFQFQSEIGMRNINRELAARGLFNSGAGLETLARFNNQLVGEEADRLFTRLFNVTTMGQNAAARMATGTQQTGANIAGIQANAGVAAGQATASQYSAIGSGVSGGFNAIGSGLSSFAQYKMYQPLIDRMTGGGNVMGGGGAVGVDATSSTATFS